MMLDKRVSKRASNAIGCACGGAVVELAVSLNSSVSRCDIVV